MIKIAKVLAALLIAGFLSTALAQDKRPLRIIIAFPAGGSSDAMARTLADRLGPTLGQPVIVEAKPGASGLIASKYVLSQPPDGRTLLLTSPTITIIQPRITKIDFDPIAEFAPVSNVGGNPLVLGIRTSLPARDLKEFVEYARGRQGKLNYASGGTGTSTHLVAALFFRRAGIELLHVPYKGGAPAMQDLLGGHVDAYFGNPADFVGQEVGAKVRAIGVSGERRLPELPGAPPIGESYPGFRLVTWQGLVARSGTPAAEIERISRAVQQVSREPDYIQRLAKFGFDPIGDTPAQFAETISRDRILWAEAITIANIKAE
ncbi:MAG: tripartite tricarboxylate transporter substrate binding protein [Betaproteobacteria bacterium]|nr:tripartite tricarboxylate transporter substrate binding protein [Betaproteobacteria bacterium]